MQDSKKLVGTLLDSRYMVTDVIGKGGSACVYKANDILLNREVALKILEDDQNEYCLNSRSFETEVRAIARLSHPNIVNVYDISMDGSVKYIVMEYVEGITLSAYLKHKGVLPINEALSCARQVLRALKEAHEKGIVHRDIKPQNIMIMRSGQIKVADFGIARLPDKDSFAMEDRSIGTVHYISPEQARGNSVDARSDLYSLAIVMYEMLTGVRPFDAPTSSEVVLMQVTDTPTKPSELVPDVSKELDMVIMRALSKRPENRYEDALDMLRALERASYIESADEENKPSKKGIFGFFRKKAPTSANEEEKESARIKENNSEDDGISENTPEKISKEELESVEYDEIDDVEEVSFTAPFENEDEAPVNESLQNESSAELEEKEPSEPCFEKIDADDASSEESSMLKTMQIVPINDKLPVMYVKKSKYRRITALALAFLVTVSIAAAGILIYNSNKRYEVPAYTSIEGVENDRIFSVQIKREHSLIYPKGAVISQSVPAKEMCKKGTEIVLTVSEGPVSVRFEIPEGSDVDFAREQLESAISSGNFTISVITKYEYSDTLERGKCFGVEEDVFDGGVLLLRVSAGNEKTYVSIPNFVGRPINEAVKYLNENNVVFDIEQSDTELGAGTVISQSIDEGKKTEAYVEEGKIILTVGKRGN